VVGKANNHYSSNKLFGGWMNQGLTGKDGRKGKGKGREGKHTHTSPIPNLNSLNHVSEA